MESKKLDTSSFDATNLVQSKLDQIEDFDKEEKTLNDSFDNEKQVLHEHREDMQELSKTAEEADTNEENDNKQDLRNSTRAWDKLRDKFYNGPQWFQKVRDQGTNIINYVGIALNGLATSSALLPNVPEKIKEKLDKIGVNYSKYVVPVSFAWNGLEALMGNRLVEACARAIPAISFFFLPFHNFNTATGLTNGFNWLITRINHRLSGTKRSKTIAGNAKEVLSEGAKLLKEHVTKINPMKFRADKPQDETFLNQLTTIGVVFGSALGITFAPQSRDSWAARTFGLMRNLGGLFGDIQFVSAKESSPQHKSIGVMCMVTAFMNILMRWVPEQISKPINHFTTAIDDFAMTIWAQDSKRVSDKLFRRKA